MNPELDGVSSALMTQSHHLKLKGQMMLLSTGSSF